MTEAVFETVNIDDIEIVDRARTELGDIKELAASIKQSGLINPLSVVRQSEGKPFKLIAGERRLTAKKYNGDTTTPVKVYPEGLSVLDVKSIELAENFYRKDFTWVELIKIQREIHNLQQEIHGKKVSTLPDAEGWSMADTAVLVGRSKASVSQDIQLANAIEQFPGLFEGCKNKNEAAKLLNKMEESVIRDELARRVKDNNKGHDLLRRLSSAYIIGDFFEKAKSMEPKIFNLIEMDTPYGIELPDIKKQDSVNTKYDVNKYAEWTPKQYREFVPAMINEAYRLAADHAWIIVWFAPEPWAEEVFQWIIKAGFKSTRMHCIWPKGQGQSQNPNTRLANSYECFYYGWKGSPALAKPGSINSYPYPPIAPQKKIHPTQRPINLMSAIYSTFAFEGSRVLIPCAGSGSGIIAAHECKMSAVATDINDAYKNDYLIMLDEYLGGGDATITQS